VAAGAVRLRGELTGSRLQRYRCRTTSDSPLRHPARPPQWFPRRPPADGRSLGLCEDRLYVHCRSGQVHGRQLARRWRIRRPPMRIRRRSQLGFVARRARIRRPPSSDSSAAEPGFVAHRGRIRRPPRADSSPTELGFVLLTRVRSGGAPDYSGAQTAVHAIFPTSVVFGIKSRRLPSRSATVGSLRRK
jgi:hypothetical protein